METVHSQLTISMSEFKKNPAAVLRRAGQEPVAVLNHNRVSFYMVGPTLFKEMLRDVALARASQPHQDARSSQHAFRSDETKTVASSAPAPHNPVLGELTP